MSVPDEGYATNMWWSLNHISTFLFLQKMTDKDDWFKEISKVYIPLSL
jgi:hypothetical protein